MHSAHQAIRSAAAYYLAPGIVGIACDGVAAAVDYADDVTLSVEYIIVQRAVVLHRQRLIARRVGNDRNEYS